jgi:signal transduction histidine kinase
VVRNGLRHSACGASIMVGAETAPAAAAVQIVVRDHGPGVDARDLSKLGEPFFRTVEARAKYPDGAGLGLAMTRRIIERYGGTMEAALGEGGGLLIMLTLPCAG